MAGTTGSTVALGPGRPARIEQQRWLDRGRHGLPAHRGCGRPRGDDRPVGLPAGPRLASAEPGMPQPLGFDERTGELTIAWVPGTPWGSRTSGGPISRAVEVGTLLADLHGSGVVVDRVRDRRDARAGGRPAGRRRRGRPDHAGPVLEAFVEASLAVDRAWVQDESPRRHVLSHGDLTPRTRPGGRPRPGAPRLRPACRWPSPSATSRYWAAWLWVSQGAHDVPDTADLLGDLVSGYAAPPGGCRPTAGRSRCTWRCASWDRPRLPRLRRDR